MNQCIYFLLLFFFSTFWSQVFGSINPNSHVSMVKENQPTNRKDNDKISELTIQEILQHLSTIQTNPSPTERPFVTLTYAQSIDGKIAVRLDDSDNKHSSNFPISGAESLKMTHALRSVHDGILVGGRTFEIDNPRLSNRLWQCPSSNQPRPIVLDTNLKCLQKLVFEPRAKNIIVCCSHKAASSCKLTSCNFEIIACDVQDDGTINLFDALVRLKKQAGIKSLMVEGGAQVLDAFASQNLVDLFCITVSPKWIGDNGLSAFKFSSPKVFESTKLFVLGDDLVIISNRLYNL